MSLLLDAALDGMALVRTPRINAKLAAFISFVSKFPISA
jgi:hypothetical protein